MSGPVSWTIAVVVAGRGSLPHAELHGEPLLFHLLSTARAVARGRDVTVVVDDGQTLSGPVAAGTRVRASRDFWADPGSGPVLLLDPLCPLVPATFVSEVLGRAEAEPGTALVAFRPVTDTVKSVVDGRISGTIDRERLGAVATPVVLPAQVLGDPADPPPVDVTELVAWLRERAPVELVRAPSSARRIDDEAALRVLECVDEVHRRTR